MTTRAILYSDHEWAFGSIHSELCKYLFAVGINASLLSWKTSYSVEEFAELDQVTDVYLTTPIGYSVLKTDYHIEPAKIVVVVHGIIDFHDMIDRFSVKEFDVVKSFAVVSEFLRTQASLLNIPRTPVVLPLGINVIRYQQSPAQKLLTVGYAAKFHREDGHIAGDLKRGYLVKQAAEQADLAFRLAEDYHHSFVTMAGFYSSVDCVITASTEEGGGLPSLEAGAAGRLVITTPVGHYPERIGKHGADCVPMGESEFLERTTDILMKYKQNSTGFHARCKQIQAHAASYDWKHVIGMWAALLH